MLHFLHPIWLSAPILLLQVQETLAEKREIAVDVRVLEAEKVEVAVDIEIAAVENESSDAVKERVEAAVRAAFLNLGMGEAVLVARMTAAVCGVEGVKNCRICAPAEDVGVAETERAVLGSLTVRKLA